MRYLHGHYKHDIFVVFVWVFCWWGKLRESKGGLCVRVHVCVGRVSCLTQSVQAHVPLLGLA